MKRFILSFMLLMAASSAALAVDVFGNGDLSSTSNSSVATFNANNAWALPFQTGASSLADRTIQGAWVLVGGQTSNVSYDVSIYTDSGTNQAPAATVATGTTSLNANAPTGWSFVTFSSPVTLNASANYYIAVEQASPNTGFTWSKPTTNTSYSALGSGSLYQITGGSEAGAYAWGRAGFSWIISANPVSVEQFGVRIVTVPEPSTYALGLISASVMGIYARRRRNS